MNSNWPKDHSQIEMNDRASWRKKTSFRLHANSAHDDEQKKAQKCRNFFFASTFTRDTFMMIIKCIIYIYIYYTCESAESRQATLSSSIEHIVVCVCLCAIIEL